MKSETTNNSLTGATVAVDGKCSSVDILMESLQPLMIILAEINHLVSIPIYFMH